jgi:N6-adenosine-specific RNA methylase IME4
MSRPTRRCVKPAKRDVTEYDYYRNYYTMGYVDDNESVDVIMQRFATQDKKIEMGVTPDQDEDIPFDANLYYNYCNVDQPQQDMYDDELFLLEEDDDIDDTYEFDDDQDEEEEYLAYLDDEYEDGGRRPSKRQRIVQKARKRDNFVTLSGAFGSFGFTTKKVGVATDTVSVMIADPSWAKTIVPLQDAELVILEDVNKDDIHTEIVVYNYVEPDVKYTGAPNDKGLISGRVLDTPSVLNFDFSQLDKFHAVLIDPPWDRISLDEFDDIPIDDIIENGYVFIWVEKEYISHVLDRMKRSRFNYIENLCWVKEEVNHKYSRGEYEYLARSHNTMLLFKKDNETTRKMDIRHQRNPDVVFGLARQDVPREKPSYIYHMIETLLPTANGFLELWGSRIRKNEKTLSRWTNIVEKDDKVYVPPYEVKV